MIILLYHNAICYYVSYHIGYHILSNNIEGPGGVSPWKSFVVINDSFHDGDGEPGTANSPVEIPPPFFWDNGVNRLSIHVLKSRNSQWAVFTNS